VGLRACHAGGARETRQHQSHLHYKQEVHRMAEVVQNRRPRWADLFRVAAITAIAFEVLIVLSGVAFPIWPYMPGSATVEEIFQEIQDSALGGLVGLDLLLVVSNLLGIPFFLALYAALKPVNESYALIALALGLVAAVLIVPARPMGELAALSDLYASAATEAARSHYLAAGEAVLAFFGGTCVLVNTAFGGLSLLISSLLMLRSQAFGRAAAWVGIVTNAAVCLFFVPLVGTYLLYLSLPGYIVWYVLLARAFFRLARGTVSAEPAA
jgi:hypothetical protein